MPRVSTEPYFFSKASQDGRNDRYILGIKDPSKRSGYKRIVFYASRREAGLIAKELYDDYVKKHERPETRKKNELPTTVAAACSIFSSQKGRRPQGDPFGGHCDSRIHQGQQR